MFMLQDQTLLQGDGHGSPILGTLTAREPNPVESAAYLEMGQTTHHSFYRQNFLPETAPVLPFRHTQMFSRAAMSKFGMFEGAELHCMS